MSDRTIHCLTLLDVEALIAIDSVFELFLRVGNLANLVIFVDEVPVWIEDLAWLCPVIEKLTPAVRDLRGIQDREGGPCSARRTF